jgi:hypothetical protein
MSGRYPGLSVSISSPSKDNNQAIISMAFWGKEDTFCVVTLQRKCRQRRHPKKQSDVLDEITKATRWISYYTQS